MNSELLIGITNGTGEAKCLADHAENVVIGTQGDIEAVFADHPMIELGELPEVPLANTCVAVQNAILNEPLREGLFEAWKVKVGPGKSTFYSLFNGQEFGDWLEVSYSSRFMTGGVGPNVGFVHGAGIKVVGVEEALPSLGEIKKALQGFEYRGQVMLHVNESFELTGINFGHYYAHWAIYSELCKNSNMEMLDFIFGKFQSCELYDSVCVANLVSLCPFPSLGLQNQSIHAPKNAEKHLWRVPRGASETVLCAVHGDNVHEARRRLRRTIENMLQSSPELQYRTDYGFGLGFVLAKEQYTKLCERKVTNET